MRGELASKRRFRFERIHEKTYRGFGFEIVLVLRESWQIAWLELKPQSNPLKF